MSTESPLLALPGAVEGIGPDAGVPAHYGNPFAEQRALAAGEAVVQVARGVLSVTGPDRLSWLDSLTSQSIVRLEPGESAESLLLDPHGRVENDLRIVDDGTTTWVVVETQEAAPLADFLDRMRFLLRVEVADVSEDFGVVGSLASDLPTVVAETAVARWEDPWRSGAAGGASYAAANGHPAAGWTWSETIVPISTLDALAATPMVLSGTLAVDALRVAAWRPRLGAETDERTIPHELDWLRSAVHLAKGCYRGQETVAKVHNLGRPPRRIVLLHLDGSDNLRVESGAAVIDRASEAEIGRVTTAAQHYELGPIALAVVKRSLAPDAALAVRTDGELVAAAQEIIVPADAGPALADLPRLPRLGATPRR